MRNTTRGGAGRIRRLAFVGGAALLAIAVALPAMGSPAQTHGNHRSRFFRNVILMIGDGMGDSEITLARNYAVGAAGHLVMDAPAVHRSDDHLLTVGGRPDPARLRARLGGDRHRVVDRSEDEQRSDLDHRGHRSGI